MALTHEPGTDELERIQRALESEKQNSQGESASPVEELQATQEVQDDNLLAEETGLDDTDKDPEVTAMQMRRGDLLERTDTDEAQGEEVEEGEPEPAAAVLPPVATTPPEAQSKSPEVFEEREEPERGKKKTWKIIGAGVALLSLLGVGAIAKSATSSSNPREAAIAPVPDDLAPNTTGEVTVNVPGNSGSSTPETVAPTGGFEPGNVIKGEPTVEGKLPNGDTIKVAELASIGEGPDRLAETFFGLVEAWANTKDKKFLDAISTDPKVQEQITSTFEGSIEPSVMKRAGVSNLEEDYTVSIFPVDQNIKFGAFEETDGSVMLTQTEGSLQLNPFVASGQGSSSPDDPTVRDPNYGLKYNLDKSATTIKIARGTNGKSMVKDIDWKWDTTVY